MCVCVCVCVRVCDVLGASSRHQPDWFTDSQSTLQPLINRACARWLQTGKQKDLVHFQAIRRDTRRAVTECGLGRK